MSCYQLCDPKNISFHQMAKIIITGLGMALLTVGVCGPLKAFLTISLKGPLCVTWNLLTVHFYPLGKVSCLLVILSYLNLFMKIGFSHALNQLDLDHYLRQHT